ncbi:MAG: P-II family nitrogen regulator [Cyclobacteriaceae bacterium]
MKLIIAIIRENQLDQVRESLIQAGIERITVSNVSGHGRGATEQIYRGQKVVPTMVSNIRLEIAVNDEYKDTTIQAISKATESNDGDYVGSGKVFVLPIEEVVRLRTGEKGSEAI